MLHGCFEDASIKAFSYNLTAYESASFKQSTGFYVKKRI